MIHIWRVSVNKYEINLTKRKNICIHRGVRNLISTDSIRWNHLIWYIDIDTVCGGQWFHRPQHVRSPWINIYVMKCCAVCFTRFQRHQELLQYEVLVLLRLIGLFVENCGPLQ